MRKIFFILIVLFSLMMSACRTTTCGITEADVVHDTTYIAKHSRDSVYVHDSVFFEKIFQNDTLIVREKYFHNYYVGETVHDTIYKSKTDTVKVRKVVQAKRSMRQELSDNISFLVIGVIFSLVGIRLWRWYKGK